MFTNLTKMNKMMDQNQSNQSQTSTVSCEEMSFSNFQVSIKANKEISSFFSTFEGFPSRTYEKQQMKSSENTENTVLIIY